MVLDKTQSPPMKCKQYVQSSLFDHPLMMLISWNYVPVTVAEQRSCHLVHIWADNFFHDVYIKHLSTRESPEWLVHSWKLYFCCQVVTGKCMHMCFYSMFLNCFQLTFKLLLGIFLSLAIEMENMQEKSRFFAQIKGNTYVLQEIKGVSFCAEFCHRTKLKEVEIKGRQKAFLIVYPWQKAKRGVWKRACS